MWPCEYVCVVFFSCHTAKPQPILAIHTGHTTVAVRRNLSAVSNLPKERAKIYEAVCTFVRCASDSHSSQQSIIQPAHFMQRADPLHEVLATQASGVDPTWTDTAPCTCTCNMHRHAHRPPQGSKMPQAHIHECIVYNNTSVVARVWAATHLIICAAGWTQLMTRPALR